MDGKRKRRSTIVTLRRLLFMSTGFCDDCVLEYNLKHLFPTSRSGYPARVFPPRGPSFPTYGFVCHSCYERRNPKAYREEMREIRLARAIIEETRQIRVAAAKRRRAKMQRREAATPSRDVTVIEWTPDTPSPPRR